MLHELQSPAPAGFCVWLSEKRLADACAHARRTRPRKYPDHVQGYDMPDHKRVRGCSLRAIGFQPSAFKEARMNQRAQDLQLAGTTDGSGRSQE